MFWRCFCILYNQDAVRPLFLSSTRVFSILPFIWCETELVVNPSKRGTNLDVWARSLVRIMTLACGAGDPGFKSQRAHFKPFLIIGCFYRSMLYDYNQYIVNNIRENS